MNDLYGWDLPPQDLLENYVKKCKLFVKDDKAFNNFRNDDDYTKVLEGGGYLHGKLYFDKIISKYGINVLLANLDKFRENDIYGNPYLFDYGPITQINHNTMMYIYHTLDMERVLKGHSPKRIVEIGGGYGGMCKIFSSMYDFDEYILIDLPPVIELCKKYLINFPDLYKRVTFINTKELQNYSKIFNIDLFIAVFSLSECNEVIQNMYVDNILNNSKFGFIGYNRLHIPEVFQIYTRLMGKITSDFNVSWDNSVIDCLYMYLTKREKI